MSNKPEIKKLIMKKNKNTKNLLSIDLESWVFSSRINSCNHSIDKLRKLDNRYLPRVLGHLLKILRKNDQKITFFVLGKLEDLYPGTINQILSEGHEVGWHGHTHAFLLSEETLKEELRLSRKIISKYKMKGFQAPAVMFFREGYKILKEHGFEYSSSIYGNSNNIIKIDGVYELPISASNKKNKLKANKICFPANMTFRNISKFGLPYGSSYFWGILGKQFYNIILKRAKQNNEVINMFVHDWQIINPKSKEYKKDVDPIKHPLFLPYRINLSDVFEHFLKNHKFVRFNEFLNNEKK
ncbi:MAG: hypothetical protein A2152_03180 [Candidatus Levybacteria bacterium RBG_16_35_6]|nr:MAG: hypothetical protein A2152_03180 [Candidatus Levybacteria bacterium RBG_16_35_6]